MSDAFFDRDEEIYVTGISEIPPQTISEVANQKPLLSSRDSDWPMGTLVS